IYHQFLSQVKNLQFASGGFDNELWVLADGNSGFVVNGTQSMVGGVWNANTWVFDIEAFHKTANNLSVYEGVVLQPQYQFYTMDLELYGMDLLVKRQVSESTTIWTGYSFMDSNLKIDTVNAENLKSQYVQPHVWYVGGAYQKNRWKLTLGWRAASGLYVRSLGNVFAESTFRPMRQPGGGPPQENPFRDLPERYPNVYSLDVSASYKIPKTDQRWWSATVGFSVINAFDTENLTDQVYRSREGLVSRNAIGFAPNLMVTFEW
ncbi:MAG: hypothetical protein HRT61_12525, partial [Ekhidna sp.]|nr:hypothetical protein [Ekhidna sp.]